MTNILKWEPSLATGFEEIDLQHKKLILVIEEVHEAMQLPRGDGYELRMAKELKKLTDYTEYHFQAEETFMRRYSFPGYEEHRKRHEAFVSQIAGQLKLLGAAGPDEGYNFYRFLGNWLLAHIAKEDQSWAAFIRERNAKK